MYILKNALRSIGRSKVRNILIGIIALVIAISACIALSIKEAAAKTREDTLSGMTVTAQISYDRSKQMEQMRESMTGESGSSGGFDKSAMKGMFSVDNSLSLTELQKYETADTVKSFYYTLTASLDASDSFEAIDTTGASANETTTESTTSATSSANAESGKGNVPQGSMGGGMGGMGRMGTQGDFSVIGVSGDEALTDFGADGNSEITSGSMFDEGTKEAVCVINSELATYNDVTVGGSIILTNPNNEDETVTLKVVGIYTTSAADSSDTASAFDPSSDTANKIYMSYNALKVITDKSEANTANTTTSTDDSTTTTSTAIKSQLAGTYVFADSDDYEKFTKQVYELGLSEDYTVSSSDLTAFEQSLQPLENLSNFATYFLIVVFAIGAIILVVLNVFNIRERKYEIGVLTAIGMKKGKVALQFVTELFIVTLAAIIIGAGIGAATSVPVTNALLSAQIASNNTQSENVKQNFGRDTNMGGSSELGSGNNLPDNSTKGGFTTSAANFVSSVSYSTNFTVLLELIAVGIILTLISSLVSVLFIMRYEPLKILSNRD